MSSEAESKPVAHAHARAGAEVLIALVAAASFVFAWLLDRRWFEDHLTQTFCAIEPAQLHRLMAVRIAATCLGLALLFAVRPLFGKWITRQTLKSALATTWRVALAISLALGMSTVLLYGEEERRSTIPPPALPPLHRDPEVGWTGDPNARVTLPADDRQIPYALDEAGNRIASPDAVTDPDAASILFAGESITEGIGVRWEEAYPAVVASELHLQPVLAGTHGYGNTQVHWAMEKELAKLRHPVAVITFLVPELLERDLAKTRPRLTLRSDGSLLKIPADDPEPDWWKNFPLREVAHGLFPYHDDSAIPLARALFLASAKEVRARGAYPLFAYANWKSACLPPDPGMPSLTDRLFGGLDVPWISVRIDPTSMEQTTHHPNAKAHRVLADAIEKALIDAKIASK